MEQIAMMPVRQDLDYKIYDAAYDHTRHYIDYGLWWSQHSAILTRVYHGISSAGRTDIRALLMEKDQ